MVCSGWPSRTACRLRIEGCLKIARCTLHVSHSRIEGERLTIAGLCLRIAYTLLMVGACVCVSVGVCFYGNDGATDFLLHFHTPSCIFCMLSSISL